MSIQWKSSHLPNVHVSILLNSSISSVRSQALSLSIRFWHSGGTSDVPFFNRLVSTFIMSFFFCYLQKALGMTRLKWNVLVKDKNSALLATQIAIFTSIKRFPQQIDWFRAEISQRKRRKVKFKSWKFRKMAMARKVMELEQENYFVASLLVVISSLLKSVRIEVDYQRTK